MNDVSKKIKIMLTRGYTTEEIMDKLLVLRSRVTNIRRAMNIENGTHKRINRYEKQTIFPDGVLLEEMANFKLTDEQLEFIKNNQHLSRTELSKKLNVHKVNLNFALQELNEKKT